MECIVLKSFNTVKFNINLSKFLDLHCVYIVQVTIYSFIEDNKFLKQIVFKTEQ